MRVRPLLTVSATLTASESSGTGSVVHSQNAAMSPARSMQSREVGQARLDDGNQGCDGPQAVDFRLGTLRSQDRIRILAAQLPGAAQTPLTCALLDDARSIRMHRKPIRARPAAMTGHPNAVATDRPKIGTSNGHPPASVLTVCWPMSPPLDKPLTPRVARKPLGCFVPFAGCGGAIRQTLWRRRGLPGEKSAIDREGRSRRYSRTSRWISYPRKGP